ncbi:hypothetical protein D1AOALGA4SA_1017 [Olavius algarvensis Delta 1 endosymbiont]|nr:hypothetical protein D1AOALGA4SA_1017 [Olavius algarvensis Delta 1 endosymbiont]
MRKALRRGTIEENGWTLVSAEERNAAYPDTFQIPSQDKRASLSAGDGVKLLFDIETKENGRVIDRGTDRMWVIIKARSGSGYVGILDKDPGIAENLNLNEGDAIVFGPEHICEISKPPHEYIMKKYGPAFFQE